MLANFRLLFVLAIRAISNANETRSWHSYAPERRTAFRSQGAEWVEENQAEQQSWFHQRADLVKVSYDAYA